MWSMVFLGSKPWRHRWAAPLLLRGRQPSTRSLHTAVVTPSMEGIPSSVCPPRPPPPPPSLPTRGAKIRLCRGRHGLVDVIRPTVPFSVRIALIRWSVVQDGARLPPRFWVPVAQLALQARVRTLLGAVVSAAPRAQTRPAWRHPARLVTVCLVRPAHIHDYTEYFVASR